MVLHFISLIKAISITMKFLKKFLFISFKNYSQKQLKVSAIEIYYYGLPGKFENLISSSILESEM